MKAAALMDALINNHPFMDGNKRTGVTAAGLFLRINGRKLSASSKDLETVTLRVATEDMQIAELATWLRSNTIPMKDNDHH
jgi:death-on-curing protein